MKNLFVRYFTFDIFIIKGILPARESTIQYSITITEMVFLNLFRSPGIDSYVSLGRYVNPIPTRFLAPRLFKNSSTGAKPFVHVGHRGLHVETIAFFDVVFLASKSNLPAAFLYRSTVLVLNFVNNNILRRCPPSAVE